MFIQNIWTDTHLFRLIIAIDSMLNMNCRERQHEL